VTVKSLKLRNFRNYALQEIEFGGSVNVIYGKNAQGKTNILEAIFLCSTGRSHRTPKDTDMIMHSADSLSAEVVFGRRGLGDASIAVEIHRSGKKAISADGAPLKRMGDIMGRLNSVAFSPDDLAIIKSEPQARRRFLDIFISQAKPAYFFSLHQYIRILRQRNALLRDARGDRRMLGEIGAWDELLADAGARIVHERRLFVGRLGRRAQECHAAITGGGERLEIAYAQSARAPGGAGWGLVDAMGERLETGYALAGRAPGLEPSEAGAMPGGAGWAPDNARRALGGDAVGERPETGDAQAGRATGMEQGDAGGLPSGERWAPDNERRALGEKPETGYAQAGRAPGLALGDAGGLPGGAGWSASGAAGGGAGAQAGAGTGAGWAPRGAGDAGYAGAIAAIRDAYLQQLRKSADVDIMRMSTTYGPHKDDLSFRLDGRNIRVYGSQGQQRTAALALKMAQIGVMEEETGFSPVLLLDDVMSELDSARQAQVPLGAGRAQAMITCTDRERVPAFGRLSGAARGEAEDAEKAARGEAAKAEKAGHGAATKLAAGDGSGDSNSCGSSNGNGGTRGAEAAPVFICVSGGSARREE
jgi:DNA replication and repair protein RecF